MFNQLSLFVFNLDCNLAETGGGGRSIGRSDQTEIRPFWRFCQLDFRFQFVLLCLVVILKELKGDSLKIIFKAGIRSSSSEDEVRNQFQGSGSSSGWGQAGTSPS